MTDATIPLAQCSLALNVFGVALVVFGFVAGIVLGWLVRGDVAKAVAGAPG